MIVALTGSTGFSGRHLVPLLCAAGHQVVAVVRPGTPLSRCAWLALPGVRVAQAQLSDQPAMADAFGGCDVVIHALAALTGDEATQHAVTVGGTEVVLRAMANAGVRKLVGLSSLSVYDYTALKDGDVLTEASALERQPASRDAYARCKLQQEALFAAFAAQAGHAAVVLRPGIFYDHTTLWNFALGRPLGRKAWLVIGPSGPDAEVPLVHVADVAAAVELAARRVMTMAQGAQVFNLVESPVPLRQSLLAALNRRGPKRWLLTLPWGLHCGLAALAAVTLGALRGSKSLPGLLHPQIIRARYAPIRYASTQALDVLGWRPARHALADLVTPSTGRAVP